MKGKQLAIVLVLLVVLGGAALWMTRKESASWSSSSTGRTDAKLLQFPLNDVARLTIKSGTAEVNLAKKDDVWTVQERAGYAADFEKVSSLMRKLWELKPVQDVKIGASQLGRLQLTEPAAQGNGGTLIDLKDGSDKRVAALLVGKSYMRNADGAPGMPASFAAGRYVMAQDGSNHVYLVAETLDEVQWKAEQWLNREFVKVENPKQIAVTSTNPEMSYTLVRENASAPWTLADQKPGEEFDASKASSVASAFAGPSFTDVLAPDAPAAETGLDQPSVVRVETFDGFNYTFRIGKVTGESYPVTVELAGELPKERTAPPDEKPEEKARLDQEFQTKQKTLAEKLAKEQKLQGRPYLLPKGTVELVLKDRSTLMKAPSPTPAPAAASPTSTAAPAAAPSPTAKAKKK